MFEEAGCPERPAIIGSVFCSKAASDLQVDTAQPSAGRGLAARAPYVHLTPDGTKESE